MTESKQQGAAKNGRESTGVAPGDVEPESFVKRSWTRSEIGNFRAALIDWYRRHRRELPWRGDVDPYETWVAEVMLQQTQVATVIDYYRRWLERFPDVESLANADRQDVMELWEGLGYYRRARFLHESAQKVVEEFEGSLPDSAAGLKQLKGIGDYTAGAIASIAFDESEPVVDGNVGRVLARLRRISGDPTSTDFRNVSWAMADRLVDPDEPGDFNQAMMELGATVCTPSSPTCMLCPVSEHCEAFREGEVEQYPEPVERMPRRRMHVVTVVPVRATGGHREVLVVKRPDEGLFAGLWEFPSLEVDAEEDATEAEVSTVQRVLPGELSDRVVGVEQTGRFQHLLTHIEMNLVVYEVEVDDGARPNSESLVESDSKAVAWVSVDALDEVPMSTAMRKVEALLTTE